MLEICLRDSTDGRSVEAEARCVVHAAFLNLRQCGRPVDVRLTYSQSIEVGIVLNHQSFHGVSFAWREFSKCFAVDEQRHGAGRNRVAK
jgi:plasmid stability protein